MKQFIESEVNIINAMFRHNNIMAKVVKAENVLNSFIRYRLSLHASQQFTAVEKISRELSAAINKNRQRNRLPTTEIITVTNPSFGLEVSHISPKSLQCSNAIFNNLNPDSMLAGLSTIDLQPEILDFNKTPHTLIAGMTNAGKSVLLQMLVLSLAANSPDVQFVFIDLKNEDLVPFKKLPNVISFNSDYESALHAIDFMIDEKTKRIEHNVGNRIVLVIDELASLAIDKKNAQRLGDLTQIGRSKRLNLIAATQSVTKDGGIGTMMKSNFNCRLIGLVANGMSAIATGLPNMQAHKLPGFGSFLRIEGTNTHRFQSYYLEPSDVSNMVRTIKVSRIRGGYGVDITGYNQHNHQIYTSEQPIQSVSGYFPIGQFRDLKQDEIAEVKRLASLQEFQYQNKPSLNKLAQRVYGSKSPERLQKIKEVLND